MPDAIAADLTPVNQIPAPPVITVPQGSQYSATETYSKHILGASSFQMYYLYAKGWGGKVPYPWEVQPNTPGTTGSPYIINLNEPMEIGVCLEFDHSPLTELLMCLGTDVNIDFAFEGFGKAAVETDVDVTVTTMKDRFRYLIKYVGTPKQLGLTAGYYELAATATIGPSAHACGNYIFGYGYIGEVRFQVYQGPLPA